MSTTTLDPIFVTVAEAARLLALTPWSAYKLCESGEIDSRLHNGRRLVRLESIRAYAEQ